MEYYCCSLTQLCPTLCDPMDCSTPGFSVFYHLPELAQTLVHRISDAIQPSQPLSSPSPPVFPSMRVFSNDWALPIRWQNYWSLSFIISWFNEYSGLISFRIDWFSLLAVQGTLRPSPAPQFKSINSLNHAEILYRGLLDSRYQKKINKTLPMVLSKQIKAQNKNGKASDPHTVQFTKEKGNLLTYI